ncbi:MAG: hypothetical protein RL685_4562 [Pseudomonadota bacterium]|jgi:hypothetical protein
MTPARERLQRLLALTRGVLPSEPGARAELCRRWAAGTGLSPEGVAAALAHCLELEPSEAELAALESRSSPAARAHVILPGQVFVAAHRALGLALAAAPEVYVKPSRRDGTLIAALAARAEGLFQCVEQLPVQRGDHVWAYGADVTLEALRRQLPAGVVLHAHGTGFGVAVIAASASAERRAAQAAAIARDTALFDQRGCLSPRLVLVRDGAAAQQLAVLLCGALAQLGTELPRGQLTPDERAEESWYRQCVACFAPLLDSGQGTVSVRDVSSSELASAAALLLPPVGRHLQVIPVAQLEPALLSLAPWLTSVSCDDAELRCRLEALLPRARVCELGRMQSPAFDGPVDRRPAPTGEVI